MTKKSMTRRKKEARKSALTMNKENQKKKTKPLA